MPGRLRRPASNCQLVTAAQSRLRQQGEAVARLEQRLRGQKVKTKVVTGAGAVAVLATLARAAFRR